MLTVIAFVVFVALSVWNTIMAFVLVDVLFSSKTLERDEWLHIASTYIVWFFAGAYLFGLY